MKQNIIRRDHSLDFIKGLLIYLVLWGHFSCYTSCSARYDLITRYIMLFSMPLFIFISGSFQKDCTSIHSFLTDISKSFNRLLIPLFSWSIICLIILSLFSGVVSLTLSPLFIFWFLPCLFTLIVILKVLTFLHFKFKINKFFLFTLVFLILLFVKIPFHIPFMYPFFVLGYYYNLIHEEIKDFDHSKSFIVILLLLSIYVGFRGYYYPFDATFYVIDNFILNDFSKLSFILERYILYISACLLSFFSLKYLYTKLEKYRTIQILCTIGEQTLFIYLAHITVLFYIYKPFISSVTHGEGLLTSIPFIRDNLFCITISIILLKLCSYIYIVLQKHKLIKKYLLGEKP